MTSGMIATTLLIGIDVLLVVGWAVRMVWKRRRSAKV